ncbi:DNA-protecting protein DprA [Candidatus Saccharibacteria bacterium]|nr:DNA-protecting protein DprA [Candidatus Saccharibacteria bacterium]
MSTLFTNFFQKINQISPLETDFTEVLESIALTPKTLYFYGKMPENVVKSQKSSTKRVIKERHKTVAIVGSRHNTRYGEEIAYHLAYELAKHGVIIVSGLAYGIDSIAHRGCLDAGGTTVAVLGTRIDDIYPKEHLPLATKIIKTGGAIISEYAPASLKNAPFGPAEFIDQATGRRRIEQKASFLYRNRLISGLSDIVVVVEAAEKSGSLNTAAHAIEQGKTVFAVPGNITSPYSQGCNKLIKQGAIPYTEPDDILRELFPEEYTKKLKKRRVLNLIGDNDVETLILRALAAGARSGEDVMQLTHLPPEVFNESITLLEIKSRVRSLGMNTWSLT